MQLANHRIFIISQVQFFDQDSFSSGYDGSSEIAICISIAISTNSWELATHGGQDESVSETRACDAGGS